MITDREYYIQSLRDHLYYLRTIRGFCITIELSFYKNNEEYISIAEDFSRKSEELSKEAISYTGGLISNEALKNNIYVSEYTLPCEELTEKLFGIFIDTTITKEELNFREGINQNINSELINNIKILNNKALTFAKNFKMFCNDIKAKLDSNKLFSFSYIDFFSYLFDEVDTYTEDLERIIAMESYSPIYATGFAYNFANTLLKTAKFIRDWINPSNSDVFDLASYYVNAFNEIIDKYLKSDISPDSQEELSKTMKNLLVDYQDFIKNLLERLVNFEIYFITPPVSIDNIYTSVNFYKFIMDLESEENNAK